MNALEWLKKRQADSLRNQAIFDAVPFEQTAHGFMARNYKKPEVKNKLVEKRGNATLTKEWVDDDRSYAVSVPPMPQTIREVASGYERQPETPVPPNAWLDAMRHRTYNPNIYQRHIAGEDILGRPVTREQADQPTDFQYTHGDPRRSYVFGDMMAPGVGSTPLPEGVVYPTFTPRGASNGNMGYRKHLLNIGNILNRMGRTFQGIDDRRERNRINRLMRFNPDPYYRGGLY
tara:strand:- start:51 stop:746 length:696 start_codon:yes stop_codon:yes gene_type:complete